MSSSDSDSSASSVLLVLGNPPAIVLNTSAAGDSGVISGTDTIVFSIKATDSNFQESSSNSDTIILGIGEDFSLQAPEREAGEASDPQAYEQVPLAEQCLSCRIYYPSVLIEYVTCGCCNNVLEICQMCLEQI